MAAAWLRRRFAARLRSVRVYSGRGCVRKCSHWLLCSKSRVAPLKVQTIPRLELCAALLLANLMSKVIAALNCAAHGVTYWSDSLIVLSWLRLQPSVLTVFVSSRVARIQELTKSDEWRHIPTDSNPANCLSRGIDPRLIAGNSLWWNGPDFLSREVEHWPGNLVDSTTSEKVRTSSITLHTRII